MSIHYIFARSALWRLMVCVVFALLGALPFVSLLQVDNGSEGMEFLRKRAARLIVGNGCMPGSAKQAQGTESRGAARVVIYVLGGTQDSLKLKFRTAVDLYQKGKARNLMIASSEGKTEYAVDLGRNLTNDEWMVRQLTGQGVKCEDIIFINLQDGYFGTLREAKTLKAICIERGFKKLLLVCSAYHYKRVRGTFLAMFKNTGVEIDIHSAAEQVGLRGHFIEYLKLIFYDNVLIH